VEQALRSRMGRSNLAKVRQKAKACGERLETRKLKTRRGQSFGSALALVRVSLVCRCLACAGCATWLGADTASVRGKQDNRWGWGASSVWLGLTCRAAQTGVALGNPMNQPNPPVAKYAKLYGEVGSGIQVRLGSKER
jgi:hypothetical protein